MLDITATYTDQYELAMGQAYFLEGRKDQRLRGLRGICRAYGFTPKIYPKLHCLNISRFGGQVAGV
jgi:hypothetical protein